MKKIFLFILLGVVTFSCTKDPVRIEGGSKQSVKARLTISGYSQVNTKTTDEYTINELWVLQYIDSKLIKKIHLPAATLWTGFDLAVDNMPAGEGNAIYFFANTVGVDDPIGDDPAFEVGQSMLSDLSAYKFPVTETSFDTYLPMRGEYREAITAGFTTNVDVTMTRMVAKIDFEFDATSLNQFVASSIQLCRVPGVTALPANPYQPALPDQGMTAPDPDHFSAYPWGNVFADYPEQPMQIDLTQKGKATWYMAENVRGSFESVLTNFNKRPAFFAAGDTDSHTKYTYILLKGTCIDNNRLLDVSYKIYLGGNSTGDMNLIANTNYKVRTTITGTNTADTRIIATEVDIKNTQAPRNLSNCYIINAKSAGQIFFIPVLQAENGITAVNATGGTQISLPSASSWTPEVLWQTWQATSMSDQLGLSRFKGDDDNDYIRVVIPSGVNNGNNAVVAISDSNGIIWSWHLWITDYNPYSEDPAAMNGKLHTYAGKAFESGWAQGKHFMDRNLGAVWTGGTPEPTNDAVQAGKAYGLLYQWGRKDPFPGASGSSVIAATSAPIYGGGIGSAPLDEGTGSGTGINKIDVQVAGNLANAVRNPKIFYSSAGDWYTNSNSYNDTLWTRPSAGLKKSVFDPCPLGYRVPDGGSNVNINPWTSFSEETSSFIADGKPSNNFPWYAKGENEGPGLANTNGITANTIDPTSGRLYTVNGVNAWYPAAGYRAARDGEFIRNSSPHTDILGTFGATWSASPHTGRTVSANYLAFDGKVRPNGTSHRAFGFGVRCVKDNSDETGIR